MISTWARQVAVAILGAVLAFASSSWGQTEVQRGRAGGEWIPAVQQEWEKYGRKYFQSVPADRPHATLRLRDSANRAGVGQFEIWLLIDGELVKDWTKAGDLRISPGQHCIRVEMVGIPSRYEGTLLRAWPRPSAGSEDLVHFSRDSKTGFTAKYELTKIAVKLDDLFDPQQMKFDSERPKNPEAAYAYCLDHVLKRRSR